MTRAGLVCVCRLKERNNERIQQLTKHDVIFLLPAGLSYLKSGTINLQTVASREAPALNKQDTVRFDRTKMSFQGWSWIQLHGDRDGGRCRVSPKCFTVSTKSDDSIYCLKEL